MHRGHDDHHGCGGGSHPAVAGVGHNRPEAAGRTAQWQVPHRDAQPAADRRSGDHEADLDLVEAAFVEGFLGASDPTSFLRLAQIRFEGTAPDGARLVLLRVEVDSVADIGSVTPHLGGGSFRYDPLPARMVSRRRRLRFTYFDGREVRSIGLSEATALAAA